MAARRRPEAGANSVSETDLEAVRIEAHEAARSPVERMVERFVAWIGGQAHAHAVFGDPVTQAGVTVIPVARVFGGFGGGAGDDGGRGVGAGAGFAALPIGFIEIKDGAARFRPIDPLFGSVGVYGLVARAAGALTMLTVDKLSRRKAERKKT